MSSFNFPLLSIPLYYVIAVVPHAHASGIASRGDFRRHDNRNPASTELLTNLKAKLSPKAYARFERAKSCHRNHLENMPLFIAAVLASLFVEKQTGLKLDTSFYTAIFLVSRVLYTANYITTTTQTWSYVRSLLYFVGVGVCFTMLIKSARALGSE